MLKILFLGLLSFSIFAEKLVPSGVYSCKAAGSSYITDGRGSSAKYLSGNLTVYDSNLVVLTQKGIFNVKGRRPRKETLTVRGSKAMPEMENRVSFPVKLSKKVVYFGKTLGGTASVDFGQMGIPEVRYAQVSIKTPIGNYSLICSKRIV